MLRRALAAGTVAAGRRNLCTRSALPKALIAALLLLPQAFSISLPHCELKMKQIWVQQGKKMTGHAPAVDLAVHTAGC